MPKSEVPKKIYCLGCREKRPCDGVELVETKFKSKKSGAEMVRLSWMGTCAVCHRRVSRFAKMPKEPVAAAADPVPDTAPAKVEPEPMKVEQVAVPEPVPPKADL